MSPLDELAGWAATNEDQLRAFVVQLDELVADGVPAACELAEEFRVAKSAGWVEGNAVGHWDESDWAADSWDDPRHACYKCRTYRNPYEPEAGESDGS